MTDWKRLGLPGPTDDLIAIKRAYALKLKVTRPDDDAAAYQALREAYDRAQHYARWRQQFPGALDEAAGEDAAGEDAAEEDAAEPREEAPATEAGDDPGPAPGAAPADREDAPAPSPAPAQAEPAFIPMPVGPSPEQLCAQVLEMLRGPRQALVAYLPALARELHDLPLARQAEASVRFADLVLQARVLPAELAQLLQNHFGWLDDFRSERLLGTPRAAALAQALGGLERHVSDPTTLRMHAETLAIHRLFGKGRHLHALLIASLMGTYLRQQIESAGPSLLRRMGVGVDSQQHLARLVTQGEWVRTAGVALLVFLLGLVLTGSSDSAMRGTLLAAGLGMVGPLFLLWGLGIVYLGRRRVVLPARLVERLRLYRFNRWWPWVGMGLLAAAALMGGPALDHGPAWWFVGSVVLGLLGLRLTLPETPDQGFLAVALWLYEVLAMRLQQPLWFVLVGVWVLAGMQVNLQRLYPLEPEPRSPWTASGGDILKPLLLVTVGLPTLLSRLAERAGFRFVVAGLLLAFTPTLMEAPLSRPVAVFAAPGLALTLLMFIQRHALRLARRLAAPGAA